MIWIVFELGEMIEHCTKNPLCGVKIICGKELADRFYFVVFPRPNFTKQGRASISRAKQRRPLVSRIRLPFNKPGVFKRVHYQLDLLPGQKKYAPDFRNRKRSRFFQHFQYSAHSDRDARAIQLCFHSTRQAAVNRPDQPYDLVEFNRLFHHPCI